MSPTETGNIPTNSYGQCVACGLLTAECRCDRPVAEPPALAPQETAPTTVEPTTLEQANDGPQDPTPEPAALHEQELAELCAQFGSTEMTRWETDTYRGELKRERGRWGFTGWHRKTGKRTETRYFDTREALIAHITECYGENYREVTNDGASLLDWATDKSVKQPRKEKTAANGMPRAVKLPAPKSEPHGPTIPVAVVPLPEQVPLELRQRNQWCCWQPRLVGERWMKPPYGRDGLEKDWQNNLGSFDEMCATALRKKHGIGYKPQVEDGLVFIDFDECRKGEDFDPAVLAWVKAFSGAYCEVTPSGTGLRVIVKGKCREVAKAQSVPGSAWKSTIEIYTQKNYVTVTGIHWGTPHLVIGDGQTSLDLLLAKLKMGTAADERPDNRARTVEQIRSMYAEMLKTFRGMVREEDSQNDQLNSCAWVAARALLSGALAQNEQQLKDELRTIANSTPYCPGVEDSLRSGFDHGIEAGKFPVLTKESALDDLTRWLADQNEYTSEQVCDRAAALTPVERADRRVDIYKKLKWKARVFDHEIDKRLRDERKAATASLVADTTVEVRQSLDQLLLTTTDERRSRGLPESQEASDALAEKLLWDYIKKQGQVFCTESGQGYILLDAAKDCPIPVQREGHELNDFLTGLGVHSGARARNRIGKHLGTMCWREGKRIEPRISFHYDKSAKVAYFAEGMGQLIRVSAREITRVPNGEDGQLFLFPRSYEPWTFGGNSPRHVDENTQPPKPGSLLFPRRAQPILPEVVLDILDFQNESLTRDDLHVLLTIYIATLFLPGIVAGKLLLEVLGDTGSAKTLFLRLLGRLVYGRRFEVTGMDTKEEQFENALVNNSFLVLDDVKRTSNPAILGMIRRACTGGSSKRRELYSTFGQVEEPYRAAVALTCSDEPFTASDEMSNRALIIRAKQREDYLDENDLLQRVDNNRDRLLTEMMVRLQDIITAVKDQPDYQPTVKTRMASFAIFMLRVGRRWGWGAQAQRILDTWREEQDSAGLDASITAALDVLLANPNWQSKHYSAGELCRELGKAANKLGANPWWLGKDAALVRALRRAFHAYQRHYGFCFTERTSGPKPAEYWFEPRPEQLQGVRQRASGSAPQDQEEQLPF
jgi:hypothetical protein